MVFQNHIHQMFVIRILDQLVDDQPVMENSFQQMRDILVLKPFRILRYLAAVPIHDDLRFKQTVIPGDRPFQDKYAEGDIRGVGVQTA